MKQLFILSLSLFNILTPMQAQQQSDKINNLQVRINDGIVEGIKESSGVLSFKGIPFAAPPVGNKRWKEPQPVKPWQGVRAAKQFGPRGMQPPLFDDMVFRSNGMSEDCLYLNVWTPAIK